MAASAGASSASEVEADPVVVERTPEVRVHHDPSEWSFATHPQLDTSVYAGKTVSELLALFPMPPTSVSLEPANEEEEDEKFFQLMLRACKGANLVSPAEQTELYDWLLDTDPARSLNVQEKALECLENKKLMGKSMKLSLKKLTTSDPPSVIISNYTLDFGAYSLSNPLPLMRHVHQVLTITNKGKNKAKFTVLMPPRIPGFEISCDNMTDVLKKKTSADLRFTCRALAGEVLIRAVIVVEVEGGTRHLVRTCLMSESSVFGCPLTKLEWVEDLGLRVPAPLVQLRQALYAYEGLGVASIFREGAPEPALQAAKDLLNRKLFTPTSCKDVHVLANLIKVWYRELSPNILNNLPASAFDSCESEAQCVQMLKSLEQPYQSLMYWLLFVLADIALNEEANKMGTRNLSIAIAPNLFAAPGSDPLQALTLSQKVVGFLYHCLTFVLHERHYSGSI
eukprot:c10427_g1_i1.p1 GENE.c10427_g1_i1~~c10427_g1_i1.p1  ORF type:complete len:453 (+),score=92.25 c10427_g1_i1:111-1469(+)